MNLYLFFKSLHLIAVISWMAGLLYLPRICVYHVENLQKNQAVEIFLTMERRLYFYIMYPAMILSWIFGLLLISTSLIFGFPFIFRTKFLENKKNKIKIFSDEYDSLTKKLIIDRSIR